VKAKSINLFAMVAILAPFLNLGGPTALAATCAVPTLAYPTISPRSMTPAAPRSPSPLDHIWRA